MSESVLNKQFSNQDIQRLRNLIKGKASDKTKVGIGYSAKKNNYEEGDIWNEGGRDWTIKDGIRQNVTKLGKAKELNLMPLFCPVCSHVMKGRNDKTFYNIHKKCFNCVVDFETKLKQEGKWEDYLISIHNSQIDSVIEEFKSWLSDELKESNKSFISEAGDIEEWIGNNKNNITTEVENSIKYLQSLKK